MWLREYRAPGFPEADHEVGLGPNTPKPRAPGAILGNRAFPGERD
jgi:hypothetical protein